MRTKEAGSGVVIPNRPTQRSKPSSPHSTAPRHPTPTLQTAGQRRRADLLDEQADRLALTGDYRAARRLRHEAHRLRRLARPRTETPTVDVERELAVARLRAWSERGAA